MGTEPIEQEGGETWENSVQRSARFCAETMTKEQQACTTHPGSARLPLSFCLTAIPKTSSFRWQGAPACAAAQSLPAQSPVVGSASVWSHALPLRRY
jgi:hypothetical protein